MKYDIAKNEDGPLRRTMKDFHAEAQQAIVASSATKDREIHPGLDDRLKTVETHLAIRYGETPLYESCVSAYEDDFSPFNASRIPDSPQFLRGSYHTTRKGLPTLGCFALQSTQPRRKRLRRFTVPILMFVLQWPPPPRSNPIIVPPHLRDSASEVKPVASDAANAPLRGEKSSLHRAVMERLEVQQAMGELATPSKD